MDILLNLKFIIAGDLILSNYLIEILKLNLFLSLIAKNNFKFFLKIKFISNFSLKINFSYN